MFKRTDIFLILIFVGLYLFPQEGAIELQYHQRDLFKEGGILTNSIADFNNDGYLDIFVGFRKKANRLYRNINGTFTDVAKEVGLADIEQTLSSAWGDYNNDGHLDLFLAFVSREKGSWARLYRNDGKGRFFTDVTEPVGLKLSGSFRQVCWIDYDRDGDLDLFIGFRDRPNALFRNELGKFTNLAKMLGVDDARKTVGAVWFDFDKDGDLDLYVANMDGDTNGLFRNNGESFTDIAGQIGLETGGRPVGDKLFGSVRPSLVDFDNDGNLDIFLANYGPNALFKVNKNKKYTNVAPALGLAINSCYDTGTWGDYNNDGYPDLYVNGTVTRGKNFRDYLFKNTGNRFTDVTPPILLRQNADHGAHWLDFDNDGRLDLALTGATENGMHHLFRNIPPTKNSRNSLTVLVINEKGHHALPGTEIRLFEAGTTKLLGTNILDTGSGYNSQNVMPVHFGLIKKCRLDVEVTTMSKHGRLASRLANIDPQKYNGKTLVMKIK